MPRETIFFAYPSNPPSIGTVIEDATAKLRTYSSSRTIETWREIDVPGRFISEGVLQRIDTAAIVAADITRLNFNVLFEVGYAIGKGKRAFVVLNKALAPQMKEIDRLGIFDTLGYASYENSKELAAAINKANADAPRLSVPIVLDKNAPVYLVDTHYKTDNSMRARTRIEQAARINCRVFDPDERPRLSALEALRGVGSSVGVVVQLLSSQATDFEFNNLRGAFVAGLAMGMGRALLLLQEEGDPVPLDYRDLTASYKNLGDIDRLVAEFAPRIMQGLQQLGLVPELADQSFLAGLDLGASAAENEATKLPHYYLATDQYTRTLSGDVQIAVGRKGSGKTALFLQLANSLRRDRQDVVLALKPEGHQLKRFKERVLNELGEATREHLAAAFWEYVLLLEFAHKLLDLDSTLHMRDQDLFEPYKRLLAVYGADARQVGEGDFAERMMRVVGRLEEECAAKAGLRSLTARDVEGLIYKHDLPKLRSELAEYLTHKQSAWLLFDNIDKGWPTHGVEKVDILLLRSLLEAARKVQRYLQRQEVDFHSVVFVRNDVYELLVDETPDRGKEARVSLDWTDPDQLKEILRRRFVYNGIANGVPFADTWQRIAVSHIDGEESADYLIGRSLMRPRNFLDLVTYCKSYAVNLLHTRIEEEDIRKAEAQYSADIGIGIGMEIRDVFPEAEDLLYHFIGVPALLRLADIRNVFGDFRLPEPRQERLVEVLLWFAFLGVYDGETEKTTYIYDVYYDMRKLKRLAGNLSDPSIRFSIHKALWSFLGIKSAAPR